MKYLVTASEMKEYDENTIEKIGIPGMVLMERAALAALEVITHRFPLEERENIRVLVLVGTGNNGGDGLALSRLLCEAGFVTDVWCVGKQEHTSMQWKQQMSILQHYKVGFRNEAPVNEYNMIIDALCGIGLSREINGAYYEALLYSNQSTAFKLALDIPSGICSDTGRVLGYGFKADMTVTFGFLKRGLVLFPGCEYAGKVKVADIGIGPTSFLGRKPGMFCYDETAAELLPKRDASGNKGTFGKLLLIAGSLNMAGAAYLSAKGAYRAGTGMVKLLSSEENRVILQQSIPDALFGTYEDVREGLSWADVIAIGPGLSQSMAAKEAFKEVILNSRLPIVIDADGLNLLARDEKLKEELAHQGLEGREIILTPHVGELSRLLHVPIETLKYKLWDYGKALAEKYHCVVVAKDARTFICEEGKSICVNRKGNSGMAVAGSGDVLCGVIAGLLSQKMGCFEAASIGTYLHALAGDKAALIRGEHGLMAIDIADNL